MKRPYSFEVFENFLPRAEKCCKKTASSGNFYFINFNFIIFILMIFWEERERERIKDGLTNLISIDFFKDYK